MVADEGEDAVPTQPVRIIRSVVLPVDADADSSASGSGGDAAAGAGAAATATATTTSDVEVDVVQLTTAAGVVRLADWRFPAASRAGLYRVVLADCTVSPAYGGAVDGAVVHMRVLAAATP